MRLLIVEDDPTVGRSLKRGLEEAGYEVAVAPNGADALGHAARTSYDLLILDLGLPDCDGLDLLEQTRGRDELLPVLIVTCRNSIHDTVRGLDAGADDYLTKPFAFSELLARIRALLRRPHGPLKPVIKLGKLTIDLFGRSVERAGRHIDLTPKEFELLAYLAQNVGQMVSRDAIARCVWEVKNRAIPMDNIIDVHVSHLRQKLDNDFDEQLLHTVRGVGFVLMPQ